ncbi:hypothetical protein [Corynebacterium ureicelerivorans]|uniref:hypothetical protein n=1 Tax=Corynebacterium ureicelerivorans TaxID=401472 RepID=UPI001F24AE95|nr:hypothetical protein [Corynebacterium ureicelerivorans]
MEAFEYVAHTDEVEDEIESFLADRGADFIQCALRLDFELAYGGGPGLFPFA